MLVCISCASIKNLNTPSERSKIIKVCEDQVDAWKNLSFEKEEEVWAQVPHAMKMLTNGTRRISWDSIGVDYRTAFANTVISPESFKTELNDFWAHISGKTAWVIFDQHQIFPSTVGEQNEIHESLEVRILEHIDGKWQIVLQLTGPYDQGNN